MSNPAFHLATLATCLYVAAIASAAALTDAEFLALVRAKYERDMSNTTGRVSWHGRIVREKVDTNTLTKVTTYADGTEFTDHARVITKIHEINQRNAKLPRPVMTNGIPARLARARLKQREATTTVSNVTVSVTAGE